TPSATARALFSQPARSIGRLLINPQPRSAAKQYPPTPITPDTPAFSIPNYNASSSSSTLMANTTPQALQATPSRRRKPRKQPEPKPGEFIWHQETFPGP
ncbi:hypothetical protein FRC06_006251, partial [Ceratobasidium sp. 370]